MKKNICRKCNFKSDISLALLNTLVTFDDFGKDSSRLGTTQSRVGEPELVIYDKLKDSNKNLSNWIIDKFVEEIEMNEIINEYENQFKSDHDIQNPD